MFQLSRRLLLLEFPFNRSYFVVRISHLAFNISLVHLYYARLTFLSALGVCRVPVLSLFGIHNDDKRLNMF